MTRLIYGLIDPITREMRYVGSSTKGLLRPLQHLRQCAYGKFNTKCYRWIRESVASGQKPEIVVIEFAPSDINLIDCETGWIRYFREIGCKLTNSTGRAGGTGMTGKKHSEKTRQKISASRLGMKLSDQSKKNIGAAAKKRGISRKAIDAATAAKTGKLRSGETKLKVSQSLTGISHTESRKKNTSKAMKKWWEARRGGV